MEPQTIEEVTVENAPFTLVHMNIPLDDIALDERNPRIQYRLELQRGEKDLEQAIRDMPEVKKLRADIEQNGGLREKIIVQETGDGKFKVLEGNCRTVCYRSLRALPKHQGDPRWDAMPARVVPQDVEERKIAILLSDMHVAGKISWKAHEKAGQVFRMINELGMSQNDVAVYMRQSKTTVGRLLAAYTLMRDTFFTIEDGKYAKDGENKWSFFEEFYKVRDFRRLRETNPDLPEDFCRWVGENRLGEGVQVRTLPTILSHPDAQAKFEEAKPEDAFRQAMQVVEASDPEIGSDFFKLLRQMKEACSDAARVREILRIRTDKGARKRVVDTYKAFQGFMLLADIDPANPSADLPESPKVPRDPEVPENVDEAA